MMTAIEVNCPDDVACGLPTYLEYVTVTMTVDVAPRGALSVVLRSPSGDISPPARSEQ
jgi:Proprotein convertase P-domain